MDNDLLANLDKLHTTEMGIDRMKRNLKIDEADVVKYCYGMILNPKAFIQQKGKTGIHILKMLKLQ